MAVRIVFSSPSSTPQTDCLRGVFFETVVPLRAAFVENRTEVNETDIYAQGTPSTCRRSPNGHPSNTPAKRSAGSNRKGVYANQSKPKAASSCRSGMWIWSCHASCIPQLSRIWNPYSPLLQRRFSLATASISPLNWPRDLDPTWILLVSDIHASIFLKPQTLSEIFCALMELIRTRSQSLETLFRAIRVKCVLTLRL